MHGTAQYQVDRTRIWHGLNMKIFSIYSCASIHVHTRLIKPFVQSTHASTRHIHNTLQRHMYMSGMYLPNLVCLYLGIHANCKPWKAV